MDPQKALDVLVKSLASLRANPPSRPWEMTFVGDGASRGGIERLAREAQIAPFCRFEGWRDRRQILEFYQQSDALVLPSLYEGMPNVVLEAMACELPVIGTRVAGTAELVKHGATGLLVQPGKADELADSIRNMISQPDLRARMGQTARKEIEARWSWTIRGAELEKLLLQIVRSRKK